MMDIFAQAVEVILKELIVMSEIRQNHTYQESSQVQILDDHQELKVLETLVCGDS